MDFKIVKPHRLLHKFIRYYWILEGSETFLQKIIPDGFPEMIFHYGDHYFFNNGSGNKKQAFTVAAGQLTRPVFIQASGRSGVVGVKFFPAGMWSLFRFNVSLITNGECSMPDLGIDTTSVTDAFEKAKNNEERIQALENFFLRRLGSMKTFPGEEALSKIRASKGDLSIGALCCDLKISSRKLQRMFQESIGVPAKTYQRLVRFSITHSLLQRSRISKADIAFMMGYFDQSHFNLDFKSFAGEDPSSYFSEPDFLASKFLND